MLAGISAIDRCRAGWDDVYRYTRSAGLVNLRCSCIPQSEYQTSQKRDINVARKIFSLTAASATAILAVGGVTLGTGTSAGASVKPLFACSSGTTCFFSDDNYADVATVVSNSQYGSVTSFGSIGISNPGSAHVDGQSTLWVWDKSNNSEACVYDGKIELDHNYGYFWISYGTNSCT
jgi:hypothetical protein